MVVQDGTELPTDLAGITPTYFSVDDNVVSLVSALGPSVTKFEIALGLM